MISIKDIALAINSIIKDKHPDIDIQSGDVKEGFKRPSFFVRFNNIVKDTRLRTASREIACRILYFSSNRYSNEIENMEMLDDLESLFSLNFTVENEVTTKTITINSTRAQTIDDVLEFEFDFLFHEALPETETHPVMEELELS